MVSATTPNLTFADARLRAARLPASGPQRPRRIRAFQPRNPAFTRARLRTNSTPSATLCAVIVPPIFAM